MRFRLIKSSSSKRKKQHPHKAETKEKKMVKKRMQKGLDLRRKLNNYYDQGYRAGYDASHNAAQELLENREDLKQQHDEGYDKGYIKGFYEGGDGLVDLNLPGLTILPEISINQIIEAGVDHMRLHSYELLSTAEVMAKLSTALERRAPLSLVRLGDGELLTLSQEIVHPLNYVNKEGQFLKYAGVDLPDMESRDRLAQAVRNASIVGIPKLRLRNFQPLAFSVFRAHGIDYRSLQLTTSTINYALYLEGCFPKILAGRRLLLVGNTAASLSPILTGSGFHIVGAVTPVNGMKDIPRVMEEIAVCDFDIALVSAGIPAVIIVHKIAAELGKVAIDFGHLANSLIKGEAHL